MPQCRWAAKCAEKSARQAMWGESKDCRQWPEVNCDFYRKVLETR